MTSHHHTPATPRRRKLPEVVVATARDSAKSEDFQARIYQAISIQRPVVLEYLKSLRRDKPDATPAEILDGTREALRPHRHRHQHGRRRVGRHPRRRHRHRARPGRRRTCCSSTRPAPCTCSPPPNSTASRSRDAERARPLVFGMLLGEKSQSKVSKLVLAGRRRRRRQPGAHRRRGHRRQGAAQGLGRGAHPATARLGARARRHRDGARGAQGSAARWAPARWARRSRSASARSIGGVGSFTFGRDVVKAARMAFPTTPTQFPESLVDFASPTPHSANPRAP